ncbi:hypothetical protein GUJ93_ZPchr0010g8708 [Zizania palustris]|uniref:Uncharacterized protein n=1 Tax=Zizania palustris TaxID=103762 RepID=A0A8J5THP4_ZIZPA|nr:hypothetical protein GUJ93_ZPchr0010g8708 [Zizania palustris]
MESPCAVTPATADEEGHNRSLDFVAHYFHDSMNDNVAHSAPQSLPPSTDNDGSDPEEEGDYMDGDDEGQEGEDDDEDAALSAGVVASDQASLHRISTMHPCTTQCHRPLQTIPPRTRPFGPNSREYTHRLVTVGSKTLEALFGFEAEAARLVRMLVYDLHLSWRGTWLKREVCRARSSSDSPARWTSSIGRSG